MASSKCFITIIRTKLAACLLLLLLATLSVDGGQPRVKYCGQETPLATQYIVPFYESHRPSSGCASTDRQQEDLGGRQVHVLRANTTSKDVLLTLTDKSESSKGFILILESPTPTRWRVSFFGSDSPDYKRTVVLSKGSTVADITAVVEYKDWPDSLDTLSTDSELATGIKRQYGALTTLVRADGANRVSMELPHKNVPEACDLNNKLGFSVFAYHVQKQKMSGCYHEEVAGTLPCDVHVIDLDTADPLLSRSPKELPSVYVSMTPYQAADGHVVDREPRNLTLILKSAQPVRWYLESWHLAGHLEVVSSNPVENYSLAASQSLRIQRKELPKAFDLLWKSVIAETGTTPVSYVKVEVANVLSMIIPPRSKRGLSSLLEQEEREFSSSEEDKLHDAPSSDLAEKIIIIPGKVVKEATRQSEMNKKIRALERDLSVLVGKKCDQRETVVTLPRRSVAKFDVADMSLNEASCAATKNETHWILKTQSTSCGSLNLFTGKSPMLRNNIHLTFSSDSEYYGQEVRIPFSCRFASGFPGFTVDYDDNDDDDDDDNDHLSGDQVDEMYTMRVLRKRRRGRRPEVLVSRRGQPATVSVGDQLKVQTDFKTRSLLSLVIEHCWIADHEAADQRHLAAEDQWLLYEGCPANDNVTLLPTPLATNPAFAFSVTDEHRAMGQVYIFCIIGLCSPVESLTSGNLGLCTDPVAKCDSDEWHVGPAAQQLSKRGPLFVTDRMLVELESDVSTAASSLSSSDMSDSPSVLPESPSLHSSHVVMVGVPAEIAVAIALASFVIGAALTGMLCCIHHRKAVPKSSRPKGDEPNEGSELQSMIASPSSLHHNQQQPNRFVST